MKDLGLDRLVPIVVCTFGWRYNIFFSYCTVSAGVSMPCLVSANVSLSLYGAR